MHTVGLANGNPPDPPESCGIPAESGRKHGVLSMIVALIASLQGDFPGTCSENRRGLSPYNSGYNHFTHVVRILALYAANKVAKIATA
jgi:hypothetical protein